MVDCFASIERVFQFSVYASGVAQLDPTCKDVLFLLCQIGDDPLAGGPIPQYPTIGSMTCLSI